MLTHAMHDAAELLGVAAQRRGLAREPMQDAAFADMAEPEADGMARAMLMTCWLAGWDRMAFAANTHPVFEPGAEGLPQAVIPGAEREPMRQTLERRMQGRKKAAKAQREPAGLFGDDWRQQALPFS